MPYVKPEKRALLDPVLKQLLELVRKDKGVEVGDLNYAITRILLAYLDRQGLKYENINAVIGVLECAKQEFYRRIAGPYEDKKKKLNGDVYG